VTPERLRLRAVWGLGLVLATLALLLVRLAWIQIVGCAEARRSAEQQHFTRVEVVRAQRGRILDRNAQVLAETTPFPSVAVDPKLVKDAGRFAAVVESTIGVSRATTAAAIAKGGRFQWLRRQVADRASVERLRRELHEQRLDGLVIEEEPRRVYPLGALAAHVVGFTDRDGRGLEGIEATRHRELAGRDGRRVTLRDAAGRPILTATQPFDPPEDGRDVRLTIDAVIQSFAEEAANQSWTDFGADGVVVAVVDVPTGDLLAVAGRPTFDPNDPSRTKPEQRRNRFFCDAFEPGSVFKPIVVAAALDAGVITPTTPIDTDGGVFRMRGRTIHEDKGHDYGTMLPRDVISRSSNVAMAKIGLLLGCERMKTSLQLFGYGARTSVRWPGEQAGTIQAERRWRESDQLVSMAFGHAMTATPAQLLQGYATLAAGGVRRELRIDADRPMTEPVRVATEAAARALVPMMEATLTDKTGTAYAASRNCPDFAVAGKTGTAQKLQTGGHVSSFACFGPSAEPRLAVLVLVDEPKKATYGSVVAAPHALRLLRQSLHYLRVEPGVPGAAGRGVATAPRAGAALREEVAPR
jgi:cell division protein FtsI (penicillin-binding protein 3)